MTNFASLRAPGLISPARKGNSPHSPRLYSDRDIERVVHIRGLMRDLGVNLAGVEAILHMKDRMEDAAGFRCRARTPEHSARD